MDMDGKTGLFGRPWKTPVSSSGCLSADKVLIKPGYIINYQFISRKNNVTLLKK